MRKIQRLSGFDRFLLSVAPGWAMNRIKARAHAMSFARHYEAAQPSRRTSSWRRPATDVNQANRMGLTILREHARDLVRNNGTAENGLRIIARNTIGWGIQAKVRGPQAKIAQGVWDAWAHSTDCDADGLFNFDGIQAAVMKAMALSGEVLIRRRTPSKADGFAVPIQLQVLEADYLDHLRDGPAVDDFGAVTGNVTIQGVEVDKYGRRVAYWLYDQHPGASRYTLSMQSKRVPADQVIHVFRADRPGQIRGMSWFSSCVTKLKDSDDYEDASLMSAKIAACFTAFVEDPQGEITPNGDPDDDMDEEESDIVDMLEPGNVRYLKPGEKIVFGTPPIPQDKDMKKGYERRIARSIGVTYEELTGDYSEVNYSSARMSRIAHRSNVEDWRWQIIVPRLCDRVFAWFMEAAYLALQVPVVPAGAKWTAPPLPMIEPDKEALALTRLVRAGAMTPDEMIRQMGEDPDEHWKNYGAQIAKIRGLGITLDSDAGLTTQVGQAQNVTPEAPDAGDVTALPGSSGGQSEDDDNTDDADTGLDA